MPDVKPEWEINKEAQDFVEKLCETYPEHLGHVEPSAIGCAAITNKPRPKTADWDAKIIGVGEPASLFCSKQYIIYWHRETWEAYDRPRRIMMLLRMLLRTSEEFDGKLLKEDLKDLKRLVKRFGVDYMNEPNLPDLLEAKQVF